MGSKSSFAVASLTHHLFIHFIFSKIPKDLTKGVNIADCYVLVGDDVVFFFQPLYEEAKKFYDLIGVGLALNKSKIPVEQDYFVEFCSRTGVNGEDVSRIPPGLVRNAANN
jgi:hypothetical protein